MPRIFIRPPGDTMAGISGVFEPFAPIVICVYVIGIYVDCCFYEENPVIVGGVDRVRAVRFVSFGFTEAVSVGEYLGADVFVISQVFVYCFYFDRERQIEALLIISTRPVYFGVCILAVLSDDLLKCLLNCHDVIFLSGRPLRHASAGTTPKAQ